MQVAELFGVLGIKLDQSSWNKANRALEGMGRSLGSLMQRAQSWGSSLGGMVTKLAAGYGFGKLIETGLRFNSTVEEGRNQIAGMLALAKKTDLNDQLGVASSLMAELQKRAASLPGTTSEYVAMLGALAQPLTDAGLGLQDLEDITVNSVVGAKAFKVEWSAAARDVAQAIRGQFHANDQFTGIILGSAGFKGETGRQRFNELSQKQRAEVIKRALLQKQLTQLAAAQGATASGKLSTFLDTAQQVLGKATAPLFAKLVGYLEKLNVWLDKNQAKVNSFASAVGGALVKALDAVVEALTFLAENKELAFGLAAIAGAFILMSSPIALTIAGATALVLIIKKLGPAFEAARDAAMRALGWIDDKLIALGGTIVGVAEGVAAPFVVAFNAVKAAFEAAYNWIKDKINTIVSWGEKAVGVVRTVKDAISGDISEDLMHPERLQQRDAALSRVPSIPALGGASTINNNQQLSLTPTITISGVSDANTAAEIVDEKLRRVISDTYAVVRGGRR